MSPKDVGDQASCLSGIEGDPDKKPGEAGGNARICLAIAFSMTGFKSAPYCISTFCWKPRLRSAAPAAERLKPSEEAMRESSSLTRGETQTWTGKVLDLSTELFCERADFLLVACERVNLLTAAGWSEAARSLEKRSLSCLTPPRGSFHVREGFPGAVRIVKGALPSCGAADV